MDARITSARDAGFTLIELMIVVTILSLLTLTVTLGVNRPRNAVSQDWARLQAVHDILREQAVVSQQVLGLALSPEGYQRMHRASGAWLADGDAVAWRDAVAIQAPFDWRVPVAFLPSGQGTPLRVRFEAGGAVTLCAGDGWNAVTCDAR